MLPSFKWRVWDVIGLKISLIILSFNSLSREDEIRWYGGFRSKDTYDPGTSSWLLRVQAVGATSLQRPSWKSSQGQQSAFRRRGVSVGGRWEGWDLRRWGGYSVLGSQRLPAFYILPCVRSTALLARPSPRVDSAFWREVHN